MLKNEEIRELWEGWKVDTAFRYDYPFLHSKFGGFIFSLIEALAELDRAKFEISQFEHPHTDSRHSWTPAQWLEAKRKEILGD